MLQVRRKRPRLPSLVLLGAWIPVWILAAPSVAGDRLPMERDPAFAQQHPDAEVLVLDDRVSMDVRYDASVDGIRGEIERETVFWIRDRRGVDRVNRRARSSGPFYGSREFEVEILSPSGDRKRRDAGDFHWIAVSDAEHGVYYLDRQQEYAVIDGLGVDDLLRVRVRDEIRGSHAIPAASLGCTTAFPTRRSRVDVRHPRDHELVVGFGGASPIADLVQVERTEKGGRVVHSFACGPVAPRAREAFGAYTAADHVLVVAQFRSVGRELPPDAFAAGASWETVAAGYARRVAAVFAADARIDAMAREFVAGADDPMLKVDRIYQEVQRRCRYLGLFDGLGGIVPEPATVTAERLYGDCKGLSTLLISLLRSAGIDAHPVLVRTRAAGPLVSTVPNLGQFDHFVVRADLEDGRTVWLDPTYDFCPAGLVPTADAAWPVLSLHPEHPALVEIPTSVADPGRRELDVTGALDAAGRLRLVVRETATANLARERRDLVAQVGEQPSVLARYLLPSALAPYASAATVEDGAWSDPMRITLVLDVPNGGTRAGDALYLGLDLLGSALPRLDLDARVTDLDLRIAGDVVERWSIELPAGTRTAADSSQTIVPGLHHRRTVWSEDARLRLERHTDWEPTRLPPEEALRLARALDALVRQEKGMLKIEKVGSR